MLVRRKRGVIVDEHPFEVLMGWGQSPATARYTLFSDAGDPVERLLVRRPADGNADYTYLAGPSLQPADLPALASPIRDTDVTWLDLTLGFLWWRGGKVTGEDSVRGRDCYVLVTPAPEHEAGPYRFVRMWVDRELLMMLQAEAMDEAGDVVRRLWIKSFKKIDDRWMIKDMEVQTYPGVTRTRVTIDSVEELRADGEDGTEDRSAASIPPDQGM
jgi:hypothetical protein